MTDIKNIERYLYDEADLLDNPDLDSWILLYRESGEARVNQSYFA